MDRGPVARRAGAELRQRHPVRLRPARAAL